MRPLDWAPPIDSPTVAVWIGTTAVGIAAWFASGTPVAGGLIVVAVLLASASPAGALYATCSAIPLIFRPIDVGSLQLGLLEIGILVTSAGFVFHSVYYIFAARQRPGFAGLRPATVWILPGLLLLVAAVSLLSMPYTAHRAEALRTWRWVILEPLLLFTLARWAVYRHRAVPLTVSITVPAAIVSIAALWQLVESTSSFAVDDVQRSTAAYLHPNNLALYLERVFFLALVPGMLLAGRWRLPLLVTSAVIAAGIVSTFSRGALIGLVAGGAVFLLVHPVRFGWRALGWIALMVSGLFLMLARERFAGSGSSGYLETRSYLWRDAADMLRDFPISGVGLDQFLWLHQGRYVDPRIWSERYTSHPHNLVLDAWLSLGLAGAILLFIFVAVGLWAILQIRRGTHSASAWQVGALASLGAGLGHGMVDNGYFLADLAALTWLAIAIFVTPETAVEGAGNAND
jgi:O-antigen ligase